MDKILKNKFIVVEDSTNQLDNGLFNVNDNYYFLTFKEIDKYNERRFIFQKFNMTKFNKDHSENKLKNFNSYIEDFKLEVIEDSTYKIRNVSFINM